MIFCNSASFYISLLSFYLSILLVSWSDYGQIRSALAASLVSTAFALFSGKRYLLFALVFISFFTHNSRLIFFVFLVSLNLSLIGLVQKVFVENIAFYSAFWQYSCWFAISFAFDFF